MTKNKGQIAKNRKIGFSIIEMLFVIAIFGLVASAASIMFSDTRNRVVLDDAQATVFAALERARSRAATGVRITEPMGSNHGIYIDYIDPTNSKVYIFEGNSWDGTGKEIPLPPNISIIYPDFDKEIIFSRLSAESEDAIITIKNNISEETIDITVDEEGIIF